jgi:plastocyanin
MKKFLTFAALAGCFAFNGCTQPTSPVAFSEPMQPPTTNAVAIEVTEEAAPAVEAPAEPMKVVYVAQTKKWGTLRAKFVVDGKVAEPTKVNAAADPVCAALPIMTENLIVGKDGALKNLAISIDKKSKSKDIHPSLEKPSETPLVLDNKNCAFIPHVLVVHPGQTITVKNSDTTGHNANFNFFNNQAVNFLVPAGGSKDLKIEQNEPAPIPVECNVHPWMRAHLIVPEHPCVGISGEDGVLEIANLPVGEVTLRVWHELGTIDEATVGGKKEKWSRGRMEIVIKEGVNDLGTIKIAAEKFTKK